RNGRSDLFLLGGEQTPALLLNRWDHVCVKKKTCFASGEVRSPPLLQAHATDLNLDGWTDIVGLTNARKPVVLRNELGRLALVPEGLGLDRDWPEDLVALQVGEITGDDYPDLLLWSEKKGLQLYPSRGNGNRALKLIPYGHRRVEGEGE